MTLTPELWQQKIANLSAQAFAPEEQVVARLLEAAKPVEALASVIEPAAHALGKDLREEGVGQGVEAFLAQYGLDTKEGVAIMCLAEALLRIPDANTAQQLIRDKFSQGEWDEHLGGSDSWLVNAASWGLLLTDKTLDITDTHKKSPWNAIKGLIGKFGEPSIRQALRAAMGFIGGQFVLGETMEDAIKNSAAHAAKGYRFSYDILGEGARTEAQAEHYLKAYHHAIPLIAASAKTTNIFHAPSVSVKLSGLHPRYQLVQGERVMNELLPRAKEILQLAKKHKLAVALDAEEANRLDIALLLFYALATDEDLQGWDGLGFVVQAYQKRAYGQLELLAELARATGRKIPVRLVKGAYWDAEIKHAQTAGLAGYPVFTRKEHTDLSYVACANFMLTQADVFYPQFGTHNARTVQTVLSLAQSYGLPNGSFEFQRLHGMGEALHDHVVEAGSRIYAPIGAHKDLLAYLIRRLLENGANSSFVHLLLDENVPLEQLLADPIAAAKKSEGKQNIHTPNPTDIYPDRKNSAGFDLGYLAQQQHWLPMIEEARKVALNMAGSAADVQVVRNPSHHTKIVGKIATANSAQVDAVFAAAQQSFEAWNALDVNTRASTLEKAGDALELNAAPLIALLQQEAGKTYNDAIAEVREAADFCRYYACHARRLMTAPETLKGPTGESNQLFLSGRGVMVCISPWNFPLAIFMGQVVAALVAGNAVLAKPAEQTPLIAACAVQLLHDAGVPKDALQLLCGDGASVGAALVAHPKTAGVIFTGSEATAKIIARTLVEKDGPIVPLIAETGGMNAMVVDSSALLEAALDDIVLSAFGSAGQRCSALRILLVQEEIADDLIALLRGAMAQWRVGNPADLTTDIGPVIDAEARAMLEAHAAHMNRDARLLASIEVPDALKAQGHFVAPQLFELQQISQLKREVFGPMLHVVRFKIAELEAVLQQVNALGYGLTFGMHSRVDGHVAKALETIHAGNIYINRSMIGATVGVQPFGGEGLSGTGPKAGGPYYLLRLMHERTRTINTTAIGGNLDLLAAAAH